jgi:hypothetical protein
MSNPLEGQGGVSMSERKRWVARYRASGLGLQRFAARHGLKAGQLQYCVCGPGPVSRSVPVAPVFEKSRLGESAGSARSVAEILLPGAMTVRLRNRLRPPRLPTWPSVGEHPGGGTGGTTTRQRAQRAVRSCLSSWPRPSWGCVMRSTVGREFSHEPRRTADVLVRSQNARFMGIMHGRKAVHAAHKSRRTYTQPQGPRYTGTEG